MNNSLRKKDSKYLLPGSFSSDIVKSGDAQGDDEYGIDPIALGDPAVAAQLIKVPFLFRSRNFSKSFWSFSFLTFCPFAEHIQV